MSPRMAVHAASFMASGIGKSGNPCARFTALCIVAMRVISRMTDSVNVTVRLAACTRLSSDLAQCAPNQFGRAHSFPTFIDCLSYGSLGVHAGIAQRDQRAC